MNRGKTHVLEASTRKSNTPDHKVRAAELQAVVVTKEWWRPATWTVLRSQRGALTEHRNQSDKHDYFHASGFRRGATWA